MNPAGLPIANTTTAARTSILGDNHPSITHYRLTVAPSCAPPSSPPIAPPRALRIFIRRHQVRSQIATEPRVPRASRPRHDTSRQRPRAPSAPPRPTGRRVPPGTCVRRTLSAPLKTGREQRMQASHSKDQANHPDPESCVGGRKAFGEALTGAHAGQPLNCEIKPSGAPTL
jgi:hypothetical protein